MRPKLLLVVNEAHRTGAPLVALETARALREAFRVVTVIKRGTALLPEFRAASDDVIVHPAGPLEDWIPRARMRGLPTGTRGLEQRVAARLLAEQQPDLVYGHTVEAAEYVAAAVRTAVPTVFHLHEPYSKLASFAGPTGLGPDRVPTAVVGCATSIARDAARYFDQRPAACHVLRGPVNVEGVQRRALAPRPSDLPRGPVVLTVGSLNWVKGIDAWLDVVESGLVDANFVWIGGGPQSRWAQRQLRRRNLRDRAQLLGRRDDAVPYMAGASVLMLTSRYEGLPLVLLEALSVGTPCAGFAVDGVPDAIAEDGVLVEPGNTQAMAASVATLISDGQLRRRVRDTAPRRMRQGFDVAEFQVQTQRLVESVMAP